MCRPTDTLDSVRCFFRVPCTAWRPICIRCLRPRPEPVLAGRGLAAEAGSQVEDFRGADSAAGAGARSSRTECNRFAHRAVHLRLILVIARFRQRPIGTNRLSISNIRSVNRGDRGRCRFAPSSSRLHRQHKRKVRTTPCGSVPHPSERALRADP